MQGIKRRQWSTSTRRKGGGGGEVGKDVKRQIKHKPKLRCNLSGYFILLPLSWFCHPHSKMSRWEPHVAPGVSDVRLRQMCVWGTVTPFYTALWELILYICGIGCCRSLEPLHFLLSEIRWASQITKGSAKLLGYQLTWGEDVQTINNNNKG